MAYSDGPRGIGGWLGLFVLWRAIGPLFAAAVAFLLFYTSPRFSADAGARWIYFQAALWGIVALIAAIDWYCLWAFVARRNRQTVRIGIALLWILALVETIITPLAAAIAAGAPPLDILAWALTPAWIAPFLIPACGWTAYLLRSKRVANTYLRYGPVDADELSTVFK
jgi:hypothetical protein